VYTTTLLDTCGSRLYFFLGSRAFVLFFSGECRERNGIQPNDWLQKETINVSNDEAGPASAR